MIDQHRQAILNNHAVDVSDLQDFPCILQSFLPFQTSLLVPSGEVVEVVVEIVEAHLGLGAWGTHWRRVVLFWYVFVPGMG